MALPVDLNLLYALSVLLEEGSVSAAAQRMNLSAPAMSRILGRIRVQFNDPILVRAGRHLVPTPHALALRSQLDAVVGQARALVEPLQSFSAGSLQRTFTLRAHDIVLGALGGELLGWLRQQAPGCRFRFVPEAETDDDALRRGEVDLEIGASEDGQPEVKRQRLFSSTFVALVRHGHPLLEAVTVENLARYPHISVSRRGRSRGPIDTALAEHGLEREVALTMPSFHSALFMVADADFILPLPRHFLPAAAQLGAAVSTLELPLRLEPVSVMQRWHPRLDNDAAHRWIRQQIKAFFERQTLTDAITGP